MNAPERLIVPTPPVTRWPGLGVWNLYFLLKFLLLGLGLLNFQALPNLVFAAFLVVPLPGAPWRIVRQLIAIPVGIALLYHDTWLPPFDRLLAQPGVLDFSPAYLVELAGRFVDWTVLGLCALLVIGYSYMANWIRLSTICLGGLIWLNLGSIPLLASPPRADAAPVVASAQGNDAPALQDNVALDTWLENFFRTEATRQTQFPLRSEQTAAFDVLFINVCSLAWDDLDAVELRDNALLKRMDVIFDRFNSATSYSGPAAIRLLRASCGQPRHQALYEPAPEQCLLFQNLANLGFHAETLMNHNGKFDGFAGEIEAQGMPQPVLASQKFARALAGFDGSPIARDFDVLNGWWQRRQALPEPQVSLFYNSISLHDGNRIVGADGNAQSAAYRPRAQRLLDDLNRFIDELERSGRPVALLLVPEHGAALHGDRMQIAGMREIPRPSITQVPVGLKLIGMDASHGTQPVHIQQPTSFLALSELVSRLYAARQQGSTPNLEALVADLPQTELVSETAGAQVIERAGKPYVRLSGQTIWLPYPNRFE
ncbi:cellulose biosynthesis protein BcsG [Stutzerimonas stutzeri]|jgi:cellulose synthase operon protein YhjU|uniref:cellulose biosynthesis protein BcsG n=1 Tax=Stutzerimonas stutzeri TaxID=316 RepID=UPI0020B40425|nr:cellulose biosynthesis protein BcsG [Stutzerimonas stutzeri]MCP3431392.1 cellulose biosynthesis protein BcsG [Stutzerimonas stutzeri]WQN28841.1 cellulose biosynthesis protein BcsG [Stutzerimonas stutzeri]